MAFEPIESSVNDGVPVTLFSFRYGERDYDVYRYTDAEVALTIAEGSGAVTYNPLPVSAGNFSSSGSLDKAKLELKVPRDSEVAELYRVYPPDQQVTLVMQALHLTDPDTQAPVVWAGRVLSATFEGNECSLACEPSSTAMRRAGLRRNWQHGCMLPLYGLDCKASKAARTRSTLVTAVNGSVITLPSGWNNDIPAEKFAAGMMEWTDASGLKQLRTIIRIVGNTGVILGGIARGLAAGQSVSVIAGCNHQMDDCRTLHQNILNYGGDGWIPTKNPIGMKSIFY